jgi:hypothetical protein
MFLSDSFPNDWEHSQDGAKLGEVMRTYWTRFAKTGSPNAPGLPDWPAYDLSLDQRSELGRAIGVRPAATQLHILERIMMQIFAELGITVGNRDCHHLSHFEIGGAKRIYQHLSELARRKPTANSSFRLSD